MRYAFRFIIAPFLAAIVGFSLAWGAWHIYIDHINIHVVFNAVAANARAQAEARDPK